MLNKLFLVMFIVVSSVFANAINWEKDFKSGIANASTQNKPVLFVFSRHTCHYCNVLDETTLQDARVVEKLNKDFISIISYTDENDYTPRELWSPATPSIWFLKPDGEPRYEPLRGAVSADNFLKALDIVKEDFDKNQEKK